MGTPEQKRTAIRLLVESGALVELQQRMVNDFASAWLHSTDEVYREAMHRQAHAVIELCRGLLTWYGDAKNESWAAWLEQGGDFVSPKVELEQS